MAEQRYVIIRGEVFTWEEKEPFERSGCSVAGAIEYRPEQNTMRCHECGEWHVKLYSHIAHKHPGGTSAYKHSHFLRSKTSLQRTQEKKNDPKQVAARIRGQERLRELRADPDWMAWWKTRLSEGSKGWGHKMEFLNQNNRCPAQTILKLQQLAVKLDRVPRHSDNVSLANALQVRFGSFSKGLEAAGFTPNTKFTPNQKFYSQPILREALIDFYVRNGRVPGWNDFGRGGRLASANTYVHHYGSMAAALDDAGLGLVNNSHVEMTVSEWAPGYQELEKALSVLPKPTRGRPVGAYRRVQYNRLA